MTGGTAHSYGSGTVISTSGVANAAPAAVYQSERYGNHSYTFNNLTANAGYIARLHFAESYAWKSGMRQFNVTINGARALTNFDIYALAGSNKALVRDFNVNATSGGQITIQYSNVVDNAKSSGIEILSPDSAPPPSNQAPTVSSAAAANTNPTTGNTTSLSVLGADDQGEANLSYTWSTVGTPPGTVTFSANGSNAAKNVTATFSQPGSYALAATIRDGAGATVTSNVTVVVPDATPAQTAYRVNCGGGAVGSFSGDQFASGGTTWTYSSSTVVSTAGVANAAPAGVYQSERYGNYSYTFDGLNAGAAYTARLHFSESHATAAGQRKFNVIVNGAQVLTNYDIFAQAGANKALVRDVNTTASSRGQIVIQYVSVVDNAKSSGIEILGGSGSTPPPGNQTPTIASAAAANPNPTSGTTAALSVLGADDGGESNLSYTWSTSGNPPASVTFSNNGTNAAKSTTATFRSAGSYTLVATVRDASGFATTSSVNVSVTQKLTSIGVTPSSAQVSAGGKQQFLASASDQFGAALSPQPTITWSVSGGGSIDSLGQFSAGSTAGGPFSVKAANGSTSGTASVTVNGGGSGSGYSTTFDLDESPVSEGGAWLKTSQEWTRVVTRNGFAYGTQSGGGGFDDSYAYLAGSFPANQSATAVIHLESGLSPYQEVEILLRWRDGAHNATGYECNLAYNGQYAEIIIWPGPFATQKSQFKWVSSGNPVSGGVHDGDIFQADVIGNVITARLNGRVIATGVDSSIPSGGAPGMGFYAEGAPASQRFSYTSFTGTGL